MSIERTVLEKPRALLPRPGSVEVIPTLVERIMREFEPVQIILLGSQARWDSDVDLLVVLPSVPDKHKAAVAIRRALRVFGGPCATFLLLRISSSRRPMRSRATATWLAECYV